MLKLWRSSALHRLFIIKGMILHKTKATMMQRLKVLLLICCLYVITTWPVQAQQPPPSTQADKQLIELKAVRKSESHPITLEDIISLREPHEPQVSPDGKRVAFILKQAFLDTNENRSALYVVDSDGASSPTKLLEEASLSQVNWSPDGKWITYLSSKSGSPQVWHINVQSRKAEQLFTHVTGVTQYAFAPDGDRIAFVSSDVVAPVEKTDKENRGILFDDELYGWTDLVNKSWYKKPEQLWVYYIRVGKEKKIFEQTPSSSSIGQFVWSPDGLKIAIGYASAAKLKEDTYNPNNLDIGIISLETGKLTPVATGPEYEAFPAWSPDSKAIAFSSADGVGRRSIFMLNLDDGKKSDLTPPTLASTLPILEWSTNGDNIFIAPRYGGLGKAKNIYKISVRGRKVQQVTDNADALTDFSFSTDKSMAACVRENSMTPPEVAVIDLKTGTPRTLTRLNPEYQNVTLGEVKELQWKNKYGYETTNFLIKPIGYVEGKRYPLLVISYGFWGKFISQAEWISSYPAQVFAAKGFAVLLTNGPKYHKFRYGDFKEGAMIEGYNPMASIEKGVEIVINMGIADPDKKGMMGWSYGSFLTSFVITHSNIFQVASLGEGGLHTPVIYSLTGKRERREFYEDILGGPPYGETYKNWLKFSPPLNAQHVSCPVLQEHSMSALLGLEMFTALRRNGKQVEWVIYPDDAHVFFQPKHRLYSMQRNLDWFSYWLQGKEDPDPAKGEQYARWRAMRDAIEMSQTASQN